MTRRTGQTLRAVALLVALLTPGCRNLERFDTKPGRAYCGGMVSASFLRAGLLPGGTAPSINMRLTLDTRQMNAIPGVISTDDSVRGLCAPLPLFKDAPLRSIEQVESDALSLLEFGDGRELNFISWVDSNCTDTMLAVVSLMKNDSVEVRLLKPARMPPPDAGAAEQPGYGVFKLTQQEDSCGGSNF